MTIDTRDTLQNLAPSHLAAEVLSGGFVVKALGMWLEYVPTENRYRELSDDELKSMVWRALEGRTYIHRGKDGEEERPLFLDTKTSANVREAMIHLTLEPGVESLPFWRHRREGDPDPHDLLPLANGLLHWRTRPDRSPTHGCGCVPPTSGYPPTTRSVAGRRGNPGPQTSRRLQA